VLLAQKLLALQRLALKLLARQQPRLLHLLQQA
jgi:hypothetical protein